MSRVGNNPITVPSGVEVKYQNSHVKVKGPKGELEWNIPEPITLRQENSQLIIERPNDERNVRALHGTSRALIANMVHGVSQGFVRKLEINGVGYRANVKENILNLELGFSHPINYELPEGVSATVEKNTEITLTSVDKQVLGQTASEIRKFRPPEPYKGKGVKYAEEFIRRKVGKKNA